MNNNNDYSPARTISINLRRYIDDSLGQLEKRFDLRFGGLVDRIDKSEDTLDIRLEGMNETREQLRDQYQTLKDMLGEYIRRDEAKLEINSAIGGISTQIKVMWALLVGLILMSLTILWQHIYMVPK